MRQNINCIKANISKSLKGASIMKNIKLLSIDVAKNVFQVAGILANQKVAFNRQIKRSDLMEFMAQQKKTEVVMEACYSSHYWARQFKAMGHNVRLLPAQYVSPFLVGNKSDKNDTIAIAEASRRPHINNVPIKTIEQQDVQSLHRIRDRYVSSRTALMNQIHGLISEYGIAISRGHKSFRYFLNTLMESENNSLSTTLKHEIAHIADEYYWLTDRIDALNNQMKQIVKENELCQIIQSVPGIGPLNATALYSAIGNGSQFHKARDFSVWLGLTPRQSSSGEKSQTHGISKRGNPYLRKQIIHGARAVLIRCKDREDNLSRWAVQLIERRGFHKAAVALASKIARIVWSLLQKRELYTPQMG
jgi:transposase